MLSGTKTSSVEFIVTINNDNIVIWQNWQNEKILQNMANIYCNYSKIWQFWQSMSRFG